MRTLKLFLLLVILITANFSRAQKISRKASVIALPEVKKNCLAFPSDFGTDLLKKVNDGKAFVKTDFGTKYAFGDGSVSDYQFEIELSFDVVLYKGTCGDASQPIPNKNRVWEKNVSLKIDNDNPEAYFLIDLDEFAEGKAAGSATALGVDGIAVENLVITPITASTLVSSQLLVHMGYEIDYGMVLRSFITNQLQTQSVKTVNNEDPANDDNPDKLIDLKWSFPYEAPGYEIQLMRLFNQDPTKANSEKNITTTVDWNLSHSIEIFGNEKKYTYSPSEGTGFYVWRVRPIWNYYENGSGNGNNWGKWSVNYPESFTPLVIDISSISGNYHYFYFTDPEENVNYNYNKFYSEGKNRQKEKIVYANGLGQVKQEQVYLPSKNATINSQTVHDFTGREVIKTIPVPVDGKPNGYKPLLFSQDNKKNIGPADFDNDDDTEAPELPENLGPYNYYSNQNPDRKIPAHGGHPYTQTKYYNDPLSRSQEISGVGKRHAIGTNPEENGKTTKTYYGTASEEELKILFGDETPTAENVIKIANEDPNGVTSIQYLNSNEKVIATAFNYSDNENPNLENIGNEPVGALTVNNKVIQSVKKDNSLVSQRRIVLLETTNNLAITYKISCKKLETLCASTDVDCGYELFVSVMNIDDLENPVFQQTSNIGDYSCNASDEKIIPINSIPALPKGTYIVKKELRRDPSQTDYASVLSEAEGQIKPITNWITTTLEKVDCIEKLNYFYHDLLFFAEKIAENPLPGELTFNCSGCSQPSAGNYYTFPTEFLTVHQRALVKGDPFEIKVLDREGVAVSHANIDDGSRRPHYVQIYSPCCNIQVDVSYKPPIRCLSPTELADFKTKFDNGTYSFAGLSPNPDYLNNPDPFVEGVLTHYPVDFEGYAIAQIAQCKGISASNAQTELLSKMVGWHEAGLFNQMVFRMLTDNYTCSGTGNDDTENPLNLEKCDLTGDNPGTDVTDPADGYDGECASSSQKRLYGTQYTCSDLFDCWKGIVEAYLQVECKGIELENNTEAGDVTGATDEQSGDENASKDVFDDVEIDGGWFVKWFAKKSIAKRMKEKSQQKDITKLVNAYRSHLVSQFLECTGYKFADIINPLVPGYPINSPETRAASTPIDERGTLGGDYCYVFLDKDFDVSLNNGEYNPPSFFDNENLPGVTSKFQWGNLPLDPMDANSVKLRELFPYIYHPVYAFKYYEYPPKQEDLEEGAGSDKYNALLKVFKGFERISCFSNPNLDNNGNAACGYDVDGITPLPCNFCGKGEIKCEYFKENWNCSQRLSFYNTIKGYNLEYVEVTEEDNSSSEITCGWLTDNSKQFYLNKGYIGGNLVEGQSQLSYLSKSIYETVYENDPEDFKLAVENKSYAQLVMEKFTNSCLSRCEQRRNEFRVALYEMFTSRCYVVGGCKESVDDNVITEEMIDQLVDKLVDKCEEQCPITTFICDDHSCSSVEDPLDAIVIPDIKYGVGGHIDPAKNDCPAATPGTVTDCSSGGPYNLTYSELTKWKQVKQWTFDVSVPAKCNEDGEFDPANPNGGWLWINGKLVEEDPDANQDCDAPDTFVEREDYVRPTDEILGAGSAELKKVIKSPKIGIHNRIDP